MEHFRPINRSIGCIYITLVTILFNVAVIFASIYFNDYILNVFLRIFLVAFNIYQLYYIILSYTISYAYDNKFIYIISFFGMNKLEISFDSIEKYTKISGNIDAIKISGYGRSNFAIGKFVLKKIGVINMFVTSSKNMFYLKTTGGNYGISPEKQETFEHMLKSKGIICNEWISEKATSVKIYKDNQFKIPFFLCQ